MLHSQLAVWGLRELGALKGNNEGKSPLLMIIHTDIQSNSDSERWNNERKHIFVWVSYML